MNIMTIEEQQTLYELGKFICMRRMELGLTRKQLAVLCGYPGTRGSEIKIYDWENGNVRIPSARMGSIARALQFSVIEFAPFVEGGAFS